MNGFIWPAHFACTVITENIILPSSYTVNVHIEPTGGKNNGNIGFRKIRAFVEHQLHNSIFVSKNNHLAVSLLETKNNKVLFPSDPYDFTVGSVLMAKFETITAKYFEIGYITIESTIGDHVQYTITDPSDANLETTDQFWWGIDTPYTGSNLNVSWEDFHLSESSSFSPRIIDGGLTK